MTTRVEWRVASSPFRLLWLAALFTSLAACAGSPTSQPAASPQASRSAGCRASVKLEPGVTTETLESGGHQRVYQLDIPQGYNGRQPFGVVLALHPLSVSYTYMPSIVRFATNTVKYRFIGVAPSGLLAGGTPYWYAAPAAKNYDVDFISQLIGHLESTMCIDTRKVFSTGISNGAQMSSLLGCRLASKISAIVPVEGEEYLKPCTGHPEPIMAFHGTADPILPYGGGGLNATRIADLYYWKGTPPKGMPAPLGIDQSMALWAEHNGCRSKYREVRIASQVQLRTWSGCKAATSLYIIDGGGHGWPGQPVPAEEKTFGPETTEIDATNLMMKMFWSRKM